MNAHEKKLRETQAMGKLERAIQELRMIRDAPTTPEYQFGEEERTVNPKSFLETVEINVENNDLSDADFRDLFRRTLPIVQYRD